MSHVSLRLRKGDEVKYLSHRDLIRAFELALRRARIAVVYSAGFNPRPRMSFGSAIGVGVTSDDERIVLELLSPDDPSDIMERLNSRLPKGLEVLEAEAVPDGVRRKVLGLNTSEFQITCDGECDAQAVGKAIEELLASSEVRVVRVRGEGETKEVDIRPYVLSADTAECGGCVVINVCLGFGSSGGAGPRDFVLALRKLMSNLGVRKIHRLRQFCAGNQS